MKNFFVFLFVMITSAGFGQGFGVSDTLREINKPVNSSTPPHDYVQLLNFSGQDLQIRWKINSSETFYPPQWEIGIQDRDAFHFPVSITDSSDVTLPDTATSIDKIILNVFQNNTAGQGVVCFTLINLDSIEQQIDAYFVIDISGYVGYSEIGGTSPKILRNPVEECLEIDAGDGKQRSYQIFSLSGQLLQEGQLYGSGIKKIDVSLLQEGTYCLQFSGIEYARKGLLFVKKY